MFFRFVSAFVKLPQGCLPRLGRLHRFRFHARADGGWNDLAFHLLCASLVRCFSLGLLGGRQFVFDFLDVGLAVMHNAVVSASLSSSFTFFGITLRVRSPLPSAATVMMTVRLTSRGASPWNRPVGSAVIVEFSFSFGRLGRRYVIDCQHLADVSQTRLVIRIVGRILLL